MLIHVDWQTPRRGKLRKRTGGGRVLEKYQGRVAGFCGFSPFLKRGNMLLKHALRRET